jgi:hypothetical protein
MRTTHTLPAVIAVAALLISCSDDEAGPDDTSTTAPPATTPATTATVTTITTTTTTTTTTTDLEKLQQPAIWPAPDVAFATPEEAAADFVAQVLGVPPVLGEFQRGDTRSGEIEVLFPGEGGADTPTPRGLLLLRQIEPRDDWFVIAAVSEHALISSPEGLAVVAAGPLTVEGMGRGFEGTVVVSAFVVGSAEVVLDSQITQGGAFADSEPFVVTLDLSAAEPGDVVVLLVRGDVGLDTDPGDFSAIPVVIAS